MRSFGFFAALTAVFMFSFLFSACEKGPGDDPEAGKGRLRLKFYANPSEVSKVSMELPDTNDFLLTIRKENGDIVFDGLYCDAEEEFSLDAGSYHVYVRSSDFTVPAFSEPQFGDEQCTVVPAGGDASVHLQCRQINSGVRLDVSPDFLTEYPGGVLFLQSDAGRLMYAYTEKRIAYFKPGSVSLVMMNEGKENVLLTRVLAAQEVMTLRVAVSHSDRAEKGISISLDTTRIWLDESFVIGGEDNKGAAHDNALTVSQAKASIGMKDVWVNGFIVGGDLTSSSASFNPPFESATNLIIAARKSVSSRESCIAVQLPSGDVRDMLNLAEHPEMLGREVCLNGDIVESYFGLVGLKNVSDYVLK